MPSRATSLGVILGGLLVTSGIAQYSIPAAIIAAGLLLLAASAWTRAR